MMTSISDRLTGTTWTARDLSLEDALAVVHEAGLTAVEIWAEGVHLDPRVAGYQPTPVRRTLACGLGVVSVHLPFQVEGAAAAGRTADWIRLCTETLHRAAELGARIAVAHPVLHRDPGEPEHQGIRRLSEALRRIATGASAMGLRLAVENMHDLRGPTLRSVPEILAAFPAAGICLDVGHAIFNGHTGTRIAAEVRAAGARLLSTHIHDSDRVGADPHLVPGDGIADWPAFIGALTEIGYPGRFVLEVNGGGDPLERLTTARSRFRQLLHDNGFGQ